MRGTPYPRHEGDGAGLPFLPRHFPGPRLLMTLIFLSAVMALLWPARELRSDNFVFYFPSSRQLLPLVIIENTKYLPLLEVLNTVGKVGGIQEKKNILRVWFGPTQIELQPDNPQVHLDKISLALSKPVRVSDGQWMVPVDFLTTVLPRLTHQNVEYQEGTNRIFIGDIKPSSFTVRLDPLPNGVRLTLQFTEKVADLRKIDLIGRRGRRRSARACARAGRRRRRGPTRKRLNLSQQRAVDRI